MNGTNTYNGAAHKAKPKVGKSYAVADAAIAALERMISGAKFASEWTFPGGTFKTIRFDLAGGGKTCRPIHVADDGWRIGDPPEPLPLLYSDEIPDPATIVFVPEGEKCADLVRGLGLAAVASSHGADSAHRSDWTALAQSNALIAFLPDNDEAGETYWKDAAKQIFQLNPNARIVVVRLPGLPEGGDIEQYIDARDSMETSAIRDSIGILTTSAPLLENADFADPNALSIASAGDLLKDFPELRQPLVDGVLRMTETMNVIDAAKGGKTHTAIDLALSIVTGRMWLAKYPIINPGPVLYIDAELHPATMARRIASICSARGIFSTEIAGGLDVLSLRGKLKDIFQLKPYLAENAAKKYHAIIFDALYRLIPEGIDENSNSDMTRVFNAIDQIGESTGAACIIIHHASKGVQAGKSVVDVGSGASAMARATDSHIIFRQHTEDGCKVMEMAGRSWPPLDPVVLRWTYPTWNIDDTLDPTDLRENNRRKRKEESADASTPTEPAPEPWTVDRFVSSFVTDSDQAKALIVARARQSGLANRAVDDLIRLAISEQKIHRWHRPKSNEIRLANIPQPITETGATNG
jgi:hypothetical protein